MKTLPFRYEVMNGKGEPMFINVRRADPDDLDKVMALQDAIVEALPDKDLYATFTREESLGQLEHDICMIAECDGEVAGYSVMIPNDPDNPENYGKHFNYDREQLAKTVSMDLTMVAPKYRGRGIQRLFNKLRLGMATGISWCSTLISLTKENCTAESAATYSEKHSDKTKAGDARFFTAYFIAAMKQTLPSSFRAPTSMSPSSEGRFTNLIVSPS